METQDLIEVIQILRGWLSIQYTNSQQNSYIQAAGYCCVCYNKNCVCDMDNTDSEEDEESEEDELEQEYINRIYTQIILN